MAKEFAEAELLAFMDEREDLLALACAVVGNSAVAEDLVQDSWMRWQSHRYPNSRARPILRRIVRNLALDWHRRQRAERNGLAATRLLVDKAPDSERILMARQDLVEVARVLSELPERTLAAFRMYRIEGFTYAEIAKELDVAPSRAHQLVRNALVHMALRLTN